MTTLMRWIVGAVTIGILVAGCAADRLHRQGLAAVERGDYEAGIAQLGQAVARDPHNTEYRLDLDTRRDSAVQSLIAAGDGARTTGRPDQAAGQYRRALNIDPANARARHGLEAIEVDERHAATLEVAKQDFDHKDYDAAEAKLRSILTEDPGYVPAQVLAANINVAKGPVTVAPRLKTHEGRKVTLQLRDAPTKMVFEVLQRETGINFIIDKDVKSDTKTSIFVQDVPVDEAIELVLAQNQLARQILASNMVIIYPNTPNKQKDYEQQSVRTFYLTNSTPKDVESMLKTVLGTRTLFTDERANVVIMRDTPDAIRMAEKLVASVDVAEPEVMLELEVLEISRSRLQDLGIQYPTAATLTPSHLAAAAGTAAGTAGSGLVIYDLLHQNQNTIGVSALSVTLNALKQAGVASTLASPRIRARNKEKAKVLIGSREPVITNSVTPTAAGTPVVTGSVQYLDVGLTLEVQPTVYLDSDVAIKLNLEVSSILKQVQTASGTVAYEIGTRNANTMLRLKDGETQILAGLIQSSDTRNFNSIPGLGDVPILGRLFGTRHTDREKDEIVLSVTPRIVRMQPRAPSDMAEFWYGNESRTRVGPYTSGAGTEGQQPRPAAPGQAAPVQGAPATPQVVPAPAGAPVGVEPVNPSVPAGTVSAPLGPDDSAGASAGPTAKSMVVPSPTPAAAQEPAPAAPPTPMTLAAASSAPPPIAQAAPPTAPPPVAAAPPATPAIAAVATSAPPVAVASVVPPSTTAPSAAASAPPTSIAPAATTSAPHSALTVQGPSEAKVGDEFQVAVLLSAQEPITRLRSQLRFDASALQLMNATTGELVPAAAGSPSINTRGAGAQLDLTTTTEDPIQGTGSLMVLRFKALAPRPSTNIAAMLNVLGSTGAAVASSSSEPLQIAIQP